MPFTGAHPLAVYPLRKLRWLDWTGLVIGATAPDWEYFLSLRHQSVIGHTIIGLLTFCLPVGLTLWVLFEGIVEKPLILLAPRAWRERLWSRRRRGVPSPNRVLAVAASILVGAATHVAWDSLTEPSSWLMQWIPAVGGDLIRIGDWPLTGYRAIQHGSTVIGLLALGWASWRWFRRAETTPAPQLPPAVLWSTRLLLIVTPLAFAFLGVLPDLRAAGGITDLRRPISDFVIITIAAASVCVLLVCSAMQLSDLVRRTGKRLGDSATDAGR
ncbi:MAG: DUF4184 family protein [Planctomycetota bacterium]